MKNYPLRLSAMLLVLLSIAVLSQSQETSPSNNFSDFSQMIFHDGTEAVIMTDDAGEYYLSMYVSADTNFIQTAPYPAAGYISTLDLVTAWDFSAETVENVIIQFYLEELEVGGYAVVSLSQPEYDETESLISYALEITNLVVESDDPKAAENLPDELGAIVLYIPVDLDFASSLSQALATFGDRSVTKSGNCTPIAPECATGSDTNSADRSTATPTPSPTPTATPAS